MPDGFCCYMKCEVGVVTNADLACPLVEEGIYHHVHAMIHSDGIVEEKLLR